MCHNEFSKIKSNQHQDAFQDLDTTLILKTPPTQTLENQANISLKGRNKRYKIQPLFTIPYLFKNIPVSSIKYEEDTRQFAVPNHLNDNI